MKDLIFKIINRCIYLGRHSLNKVEIHSLKRKLGYCDINVVIQTPFWCSCPRKIFLNEDINIHAGAVFIISPEGDGGRFIMKKHSGAAVGLTVVTGNHSHYPAIGEWHKIGAMKRSGDIDKDVVVEEDVWIGANVTLLAGVIVGRGAIIGAGSVVRRSVPPYSIVYGNPAKVIAFKYTPEEILKHEKVLYPVDERLPLSLLEKNYTKHYKNRIKEIVEFVK